MRPQHRSDNFILKEDVLVKMLRILYSIARDLQKLRSRKSLHTKRRYRFDEVVHVDACYQDNEENIDFASLENIIPSKENINWPFTSKTNSPHIDIDLNQLSKLDDYLDIME